jgi:hypothetical protein
MPLFYSELKQAALENLGADPTPGVAGRIIRNTADGKTKIDNGSAFKSVVLEDLAQTLSNKTIDADTNTITNIENADIKASAAIDATKIADGTVTSTEFQYINTLSSNAQTQLDAKQLRSVLTAKGDLYVATASNVVARQAVGTDGQVLKANSGVTNGIEWGAASANLAYRSVVTTDTATNADDVLVCSGASFTINLFTAVGNTGKVLTIYHNGTSYTQVYTIDPSGAQTLGGFSTVTLNTQEQVLTIMSDGANWIILDSKTDTEWTSFTPTGSWSTNTTYTGIRRRVGKYLEIQTKVSLAGAPTSAALTLTLPNSYTIDTADLISTVGYEVVLGQWHVIDSGSSIYVGDVSYSSTTVVRLAAHNAASTYLNQSDLTQAIPITFGNTDTVVCNYRVPISGWLK